MSNVDYTFKKKHEELKLNVSKLSSVQKLQSAVYAIATGQTPELRAILDSIAHIDVPVNGRTLLMAAAESDNLVAARMLIESYHADPFQTDLHDNNSLDIAIEKGHMAIVTYLTSLGAKPKPPVISSVRTFKF